MTIQKLRPSYTFDAEKIAALKVLFPEAVADGQIVCAQKHFRAVGVDDRPITPS